MRYGLYDFQEDAVAQLAKKMLKRSNMHWLVYLIMMLLQLDLTALWK